MYFIILNRIGDNVKRRNALILVILLMSIGFAAVSTTLIIKGNAKISENIDDFDVYFSKAILDNVDKSGEFIDDTNKTITFTTSDLSAVGDISALTYEVTNSSKNYDAIVQVNCEGANNYLQVSMVPDNLTIEATTTKTGTVKVELKKTSITNQDIPITCKLNIVASERTSLGANEVVNYNYKAKNIIYDDTVTQMGCTDVQTCIQKIDKILES